MKVFLCTILLAGCAIAAPDPRIVGGVEAALHEFPYMISLQRTDGQNTEHFCGGSIINDRWILTAAHCIDGFRGETEIVAGAHSLSDRNPEEQRRLPKNTVKHPKHKSTPGSFDVALVELDHPLDFNEFVKKVKLPASDPFYPTGAATISGWGSKSNTAEPDYPDILQKAVIPILPALKCYFSQVSGNLDIHLTDLCAGSPDGSHSICLKDSGSPLVQRNIHGESIQIGVVRSTWLPCGQVDKTGIFINVSFFLQWIYDTMAIKNGC